MTEMRAEIVATVRQVLVSDGNRIQEGDRLVILESMKMEIPVLAEDPGTIASLTVTEGTVVREGDLIAVVK